MEWTVGVTCPDGTSYAILRRMGGAGAGGFAPEALRAHRRWLGQACASPDASPNAVRLELHAVDARGQRLAAQELSGAILDGVNLAKADLAFVRLHAAQLLHVRAEAITLA